MANTITGQIYRIDPTVSKDYNGKTYYERQIVIDDTRYDQRTGEAKFANFPAISFSGDRCAELDGYRLGEMVTVSVDIQGRKYIDKNTKEEKIFNKVAGFKIEKYMHPQVANQAQPTGPQSPYQAYNAEPQGVPTQRPTSVPVPPQTQAAAEGFYPQGMFAPDSNPTAPQAPQDGLPF